MSKEEIEKCKNDPYYFYSQHCIIRDDVPCISKEQFEMMWNSKELRKTRKGDVIITSTPKGISQGFHRLWNELNQNKDE